jgi:hypothetical protein
MRTEKEFWSKVDKTSTCWNWTASRTSAGYGNLNWHGKYTYAHILAFKFAGKSIPFRHELDHLCRNRRCVNPDHLEAVRGRINIRRGKNAKLTPEKVAEIRILLQDKNANQTRIGKQYGVTGATISEIFLGKSWT